MRALDDAFRYGASWPKDAPRPGQADPCETCNGQGFYSLSDDPDTEITCETCSPSPSSGQAEERRIEERLVVTDLCDLHAFEKNENNKRRLRRAINFIEGRDCFPRKCPACFADKPCPSHVCEHPERATDTKSAASAKEIK